ncbi:alpha/beta fold hydrolase [Dietzia maris]|uniref:alpha/beta fold hydrolase n=1 Tax=Dietzia maris TaxID=37915 RepID=UPI00223B13D1|nr:alpha/beta hydrolase [Dietzia maris]MCT1434679.1 alpha/beta hydrolase [Dietzia maris]MCT1521836.1 alpha/beta hydrolase [Dietzia maris]
MEAVHNGERGHDPQVRAERLRAARLYGPERFAAHSVAIGSGLDRWGFPAQASCPVLIVGASDDQVVPTEEQRKWAEKNAAPHVTYVEIPKTEHMVPVEDPKGLSGAISDWLETLEG